MGGRGRPKHPDPDRRTFPWPTLGTEKDGADEIAREDGTRAFPVGSPVAIAAVPVVKDGAGA